MRILQISDTHIFSDKHEFASKNYSNIKMVVDFIKSNIDAIKADFVIVTGDISHDGGVSSYETFIELMEGIPLPLYFFPGNHDNIENLYNTCFKDGVNYDVKSFDNDKWRVISVDSVVENEDFGLVSKSEFANLEKEVISSGNKNIAVFLHHHPIAVGTPIVDDCMLINAAEFLHFCQRLKVRFIGSGHAHTLFQRKVGEVLVSVSPAVCSQWKNGTNEIDIIDNSAFNIISLGDHVRVETWFI